MLLKLLASYDRNSSSWRTLPLSSEEESIPLRRTWPKYGMTLSGVLYELPTSALSTSGTDGSASPSLPTPTSRDGTSGPGTSPRRQGGENLRTRLLYTPTAKSVNDQAVFTPVLVEFKASVDRWSAIVGYRPKRTVQRGPRGGRIVAPQFVEWMMGLPKGWTLIPGVTASQRLHVLGDGVVPLQARVAYESLLDLMPLVASVRRIRSARDDVPDTRPADR